MTAKVKGTDKNTCNSEAAYPECKVMTKNVDVIDAKQVDGWITSVIDEFGRLDGAANIAGGERKGNRKAEDRITEIVRIFNWSRHLQVETDKAPPAGR